MGTTNKGLIGKEDLNLYNGVETTFSRKTSSGGTGTYTSIDYVGIDILVVYGTGTRDDSAITTAINRVGSATVRFYLSPGVWTISNSITIPSNVTLVCAPGAIFTDDAGNADLTINGPLEAGLHQVFDWGNGSGKIIFDGGLVRETYPEWWYSGAGSWHTAFIDAIRSLCNTYTDVVGTVQCGTVKLSGSYSVTDTITIDRPVKLSGDMVEFNSGPTRPSVAGARIESSINDAAKDVIELTGTDRGGGTYDMFGTVLENFAINCDGNERDGIRVTADDKIYGLMLSNLHIYNPGNNGVTVTTDNDGYHYSTMDNVRVFSAGNDSFWVDTGQAHHEAVGVKFTNCRSNSAGRYGFYTKLKGVFIDNFIEDLSTTAGIYLDTVQHATIQNVVTEAGSGEGYYLSASSFNTFINCLATENVGDQFYLTSSKGNLFVGCSMNQVGAENHINYANAEARNNTWIVPTFFEAKTISDSGRHNVYLMPRESNAGAPNLELYITGDSELFTMEDVTFSQFKRLAFTTADDYTLTSTTGYLWVNATAAPRVITLPAGANSLKGQDFTIKKTDSSANTVTVDGNGAETIEGAASVTLSAQWDYVTVQWEGAGWVILGET